jgi:hypothetical protein
MIPAFGEDGMSLAWMHRTLGDLLLLAGLPATAAQAYRDALAVGPNADIWIRLGDALVAARRWLEAAGAFAAAARLRPDSVEAAGGRALSLARAGRGRECLAAVDALSRLRPFEAEPHLLRSALLLRSGRRQSALQAMRWAARLDRLPAGRRFALGDALLGADAWAALLDQQRTARALVKAPPVVACETGHSVLNAAPAPLPAATGPRRARHVRRRLIPAFGRARGLVASVAVLRSLAHGAARAFLIVLARTLARRSPHVAIRSCRAALALGMPRGGRSVTAAGWRAGRSETALRAPCALWRT